MIIACREPQATRGRHTCHFDNRHCYRDEELSANDETSRRLFTYSTAWLIGVILVISRYAWKHVSKARATICRAHLNELCSASSAINDDDADVILSHADYNYYVMAAFSLAAQYDTAETKRELIPSVTHAASDGEWERLQIDQPLISIGPCFVASILSN